jgi:hypothetical protein
MLSKNFLAIHQLDINLWTEFLCVVYRENPPSRIVSSKRALSGAEFSAIITLLRRPYTLPTKAATPHMRDERYR